MQEPSVFTRIIKGEIPSHKVYEDERTLAFLTINPVQPGHTLVIPKVQVDHLMDLEAGDYEAVMATTKKVMRRVVEVLGATRACLKVEGFEVPHAHVHVIPCNTADEYNASPRTDVPAEEFKAMAQRLRFS